MTVNDKIHFKVITHERVVFDDYVDEIYSKGIDGDFGVLYNHIPFMTALDIGVTKVVQNDICKFFTTMGGIFQFKNDEATILTDTAEDGSDIDITRAKAAKERAEARLAEKNANIDVKRAEAALSRALARLKTAMVSTQK